MTIDYIKKHKGDLIELKKNVLKFGDISEVKANTTKGLTTNNTDDSESGVIKRTIIGNTYNWLDSHGDVHVGNTFKKSIKERLTKIFHLHDHNHTLTAKVGKFSKVYEKEVSWSDLGIDKQGSTIVLMADSEIHEDMNKEIFKQYLNNEIDQHSVGMRYVKIDLAINDKEEEQEYEVWKRYIDTIGNKEEAKERGYFWAVSEAKLVEISCVLMGSNPITPTIENIESVKSTQTDEPSTDTQSELTKFYINLSKK